MFAEQFVGDAPQPAVLRVAALRGPEPQDEIDLAADVAPDVAKPSRLVLDVQNAGGIDRGGEHGRERHQATSFAACVGVDGQQENAIWCFGATLMTRRW